MAQVAQVYALQMQVVAELLRVEEVDLQGVHLDNYARDVREDVLGDVLELFAEACSVPSVVHEVGLLLLRIAIDTIVIEQFLPEEEGLIIRVIANEVRKEKILNFLYEVHIKG